MKFRTDFVTNSSSSSFLLTLKVELKNGKTIEFEAATILNVPISYFSKNNKGITNTMDLSEDALHLLKIYEVLPEDKKYISIELLKVLKNSIKIETDGGNDKQLL